MDFRRTDHHACWPPARARLLALAALLVLLAAMLVPPQRALAAPTLTVEILTWNIIGLDSNNPLEQGPDEYPVGARVCNTSAAETATNVSATFVWDPADPTPSPYIMLKDNALQTLPSLAPGACFDFYWTVEVVRIERVAYDTARDYYIEVAATGVAPVPTPSPRELYVRSIISQSRNDTVGITGPTTVYIGETHQYTLASETAPGGYEQLTTFVNWPNTIFQVQDINTTYTTPAGSTNDTVYADACGWQDVPNQPGYNNCVGPEEYTGGKVGDQIATTYSVKIMGAGTATMTNLIFDKSGNSYHYNADYGTAPNLIAVTAVSPVTASKTDAVVIDADNSGTVSVGDTLEYRVTITNTSPQTASGVSFSDTLDPNTTLIVSSVTASQGTITSGNGLTDTSVAVNVGAMAAGAQVIITYRAIIDATAAPGTTLTNQGTLYNNLVQATITDDPDAAGATDATTTMIGSPTAVELASFTANDEPAAAVLRWTTTVEQDSWGFHIYRSPDGMQKTAVQMTSAPVMARGRGSEGASYSWADSTVVPGSTYSYWLVEIDMQGNQAWYGPVSVLIHYKALLPLAKF